MPHLAAFALLLIPAGLCGADLRLAGMVGDHMVLQRDVPVPVWGWASSGEKVNVEFAGQKKSASADASGKWMVKLDPMAASAESSTLTVTGNSLLSLSDILVGDVWLCSGQSNMGIPMDVPGSPCVISITGMVSPPIRSAPTIGPGRFLSFSMGGACLQWSAVFP